MRSALAFLLLFALPACVVARDKIEPSELDRKKSDVRRAAFSEWMTSKDFEAFNEKQKAAGKYAIYIEDNGGYEYRGIFGKIDPKGWYYYYGAKRETLLGKHGEHTAAGLKLMTLSESRSDRFSAIWVTERTFAEVSAQLVEYGIGLATIGD